ncbi:uncharacterized protein GGS22DRAFT_156245 [Annulohypoxylon maeteangense]|uniref:uncharacterized protein n=1 Tax=Annulohypoxylon maeteangense TaxID=1927788 RepID=UPI002007A447|nr:uncharacterized protein GGS22DRAFT_156245 [Annulohypoxylon maeteangense]KAI0887135.1 hypothetical protein GGS22DRAFT_156245 [Annulohypoxylon maeteangense]
MADESFVSTSTSATNIPGRSSSNNGNAPPGYGLRRAATAGQPSTLRRRSTLNLGVPSGEDEFPDIRRRSSTYSDYSLSDARRDLETSADELLNPSKSSKADKSPFVYVPLTLALLPALAGIFFENGSAFFTDLILLSLAAVFLHWSVTQPWDWYQSAQEVRIIKDEIMTESVFESDSDGELLSPTTEKTTLENVPEEVEKQSEPEVAAHKPFDRRAQQWKEKQAAALSELYLHEIAALAWCFTFPMLGAYLLHTIRGQLSRPSEGLVSDYNLTIFLCAAEVRPVSHLIRMLQNRTLRVQQIVARNPYEKQTVTMEQFQEISARLDELETRGVTGETTSNVDLQPGPPQQKLVETTVSQEFRNSVQPELDALSRAMRRYEKKLTLLACQTDNRIEYVDQRLNDALTLAAVAAKNSNAQWGVWSWLIEKIIAVVMFPIQALVAVFIFPFRTAMALLSRKSRSTPERTHRSTRSGKTFAQGKNGPDRVPTRMSRR